MLGRWILLGRDFLGGGRWEDFGGGREREVSLEVMMLELGDRWVVLGKEDVGDGEGCYLERKNVVVGEE